MGLQVAFERSGAGFVGERNDGLDLPGSVGCSVGVAGLVVLGQAGLEVGGQAGVVAVGEALGLEEVDVVEGCHGEIMARGMGRAWRLGVEPSQSLTARLCPFGATPGQNLKAGPFWGAGL